MITKRHLVITVNAGWNLLNYRMGLIQMLAEEGHRITLLAPEDEATDELQAMGFQLVKLKLSRRGRAPLTEAKVFQHNFQLLNSIKPDAILSFTIKNNIYSGIAARLLSIPFLPNVSGRGAVFSEAGILKRGIIAPYKLAFARANTVFFQNSEDAAFFRNKKIVSSNQSVVLPGSGVDLARFPFRPLAKVPHAPVFVMISRVLSDKGVQEYAEAAEIVKSRFPKSRFLLVGKHTDTVGYVKRVDLNQWVESGLIEYLGEIPDVRSVIEAADVSVLPSYYLEGTPRSLLESAAMGRPIVTTDTPGCRDTVISGKNGVIVRPRSSADLAEKLLKIAELSPECRIKMGKASRHLAERKFDEKIVLQAYSKALKSAFSDQALQK